MDTAQAGDEALAMWHLPAEKKYGFVKLYNWFRTGTHTREEYLAYLGKVMMIPGSRTIRKLRRGIKRLFVK